MKKLLVLFSVLTFVLTSCSSDDNPTAEADLVLPQTISYIYPSVQLGTNSKSMETYNGNKILSSIEEGSKTVFTYDGDFIVKQELFNKNEEGKESKKKEVVYVYENGKLKTRIFKSGISTEYPEGSYISKTVYTHTSNELISFINYLVDRATKAETKISEGSLTYKDGNLIKEEQKVNSVTTTRVYEYDTKNNPLKNILGFNLLLNEVTEFGRNNCKKTTKTASDYPKPAIFLTNYTYNEKDYPIRHTSFDGGGKSIEYEIEYTY